MIYSPSARPIRVLRIATPADVRGAGQDPVVDVAARRPSHVTLVCEDIGTGETALFDQAQLALFQPNPMELAERMNRLLGSAEGG